jgi:hypothetical protein
MYLRDDRLNSLACYIEGVVYGLEHANVKDTADEKFLRGFGDWLADHLNASNGDCWFYLLRCHPNRSGHVEDFYHALDEYLRESGFAGGLDDESIELEKWRE